MEEQRIIHGRVIIPEEIEKIRRLLRNHPDWSRRRLSFEVSAAWDWRNAKGELRDMACRTVLLRLHRSGEIVLPAPRNNGHNNHLSVRKISHDTSPVDCFLRDLLPLEVSIPQSGSDDGALFRFLIQQHHYLGLKHIPGENMRYLIRERGGRVVACLLFAAAAWKAADRDSFIGWTENERKANLSLLTNNTRFLVLPWVRVKCLASHVLSLVCRRIRGDWIDKYGHPIHLLETFIDRSRFRGVCYQAANWQMVGCTVGRTRNDRFSNIKVPLKDIRVYPLTKNFRKELCR